MVQMRVEFEGIPYADTFAVEIRWVATRDGEDDIKVEVGVEVDFIKSTFLKGKIRSGTIEETASVHRNLFEAVHATIAANSGVEPVELVESIGRVESNEIEAVPTKSVSLLGNWVTDNYVMAACGVLIMLAFLWRSFWRGAGSHNTLGTAYFTANSANDIEALGTKIERLEAEMAIVRETLSEILSLVKSKNE